MDSYQRIKCAHFTADNTKKPYHAFREEISYHMGILLKGTRIIIPLALRRETLRLIHQGHLGMEKNKQCARMSVYWPGLDNEIEHLVSNCSTCLDHRHKQRRESILPHDVPDAPWIKVATDLSRSAFRRVAFFSTLCAYLIFN